MNFGEKWCLGCLAPREELVRLAVTSDLLVHWQGARTGKRLPKVGAFHKTLYMGNDPLPSVKVCSVCCT